MTAYVKIDDFHTHTDDQSTNAVYNKHDHICILEYQSLHSTFNGKHQL